MWKRNIPNVGHNVQIHKTTNFTCSFGPFKSIFMDMFKTTKKKIIITNLNLFPRTQQTQQNSQNSNTNAKHKTQIFPLSKLSLSLSLSLSLYHMKSLELEKNPIEE